MAMWKNRVFGVMAFALRKFNSKSPVLVTVIRNLVDNASRDTAASDYFLRCLSSAVWADRGLQKAAVLRTAEALRVQIPFSTAAVGPSPLQQIASPEAQQETEMLKDIARPEALRVCRAVYRKLPINIKKLTVAAKVVRRLHIEDALLQCDTLHRKSARIVKNAILSAKANGINNHGLNAQKLRVEECFATKATFLKRMKFHAKGKRGLMKRYRSHLTVILKEDEYVRVRHRPQPTWVDREEAKKEGVPEAKVVRKGCAPGWYRKKVKMDYKSINERRKARRRMEKERELAKTKESIENDQDL